MEPDWFPADGNVVAPEELALPKAHDVAAVLRSRTLPFFTYIESRRTAEGHEVVVFDVEPEVSQRVAADIRRVERVAVTFFRGDLFTPRTVALRRDFPRNVPHLNQSPAASPANLCIYTETYPTTRLRWTAPDHLRRVHAWFTGTASGQLHQPDQPLEPFILASAPTIVLPPSLHDVHDVEELTVRTVDGRGSFLIASRPNGNELTGEAATHIAFTTVTQKRAHGVTYPAPDTLRDLAALLRPLGTDLDAVLRSQIQKWWQSDYALGARVVLVFVLPKTRAEGGPVEGWDLWAFRPSVPVLQLGAALGIWTIENGKPRLVTGSGRAAGDIEELTVETLRPVWGLSPPDAAYFSGEDANSRKVLAVGAGMLGSQVMLNLARAGFGQWCIVDNDVLYPHNLVRHACSGSALGTPKATAVAKSVNELFHDSIIARDSVFDVLDARAQGRLAEAAKESDVVFDLSASPAVARHLATELAPSRRVISLFLTPSGRDLVLLAESDSRLPRLDDLEMQHYRAAIRDESLAGHLEAEGKHVRYGASCRDVTLRIPQTSAAVLSGIGAAALRMALRSNSPAIHIWRLQDDWSVKALTVDVLPSRSSTIHGWTVRADDAVLKRLHILRHRRLPAETGGALIGHRDMQRQILYIVHALHAPKDSKEDIAFFERGCVGLRDEVALHERMTGGALTYIGEWHSHPRNSPVGMSDRDISLFGWLTTRLRADGVPPLMVIVGDDTVGVYVSEPTLGAEWITS